MMFPLDYETPHREPSIWHREVRWPRSKVLQVLAALLMAYGFGSFVWLLRIAWQLR
jgi:hypothetical protein